MSDPTPAPLAVLMSGGLDSSILLAHLADQGHRVQPLYIRSNLIWQRDELAAAERFLAAIAQSRITRLVVLELRVDDLYGSHWSVTGRHTPDENTSDDAVYLPGRNPLLLVKAFVWCHLHAINRLALAPLGSNPFADATDEFFAEFETALNRALSGHVKIVRPFGKLDKRQVMELGRGYPLGETFSCIAPVDGVHCGRCNKCAERRTAFRLIGMVDPTVYHDRATTNPGVAAPGLLEN
jgi:7-cyano-7-deazaguanine synthase